MSRLYGPWPAYIRSHFIWQLDLYAAVLRDRLLPAFEKIDEEAKKVEDEAYERLCRSSSDSLDIGSLAEKATEEAADFLLGMWRIKQAQINLQTVGLYHLFEQQLLDLHRRWLLPLDRARATAELKIEYTTAELLNDGIDVKRFPAWAKVDELRLVANCAKHGEGDSCKQLRKRRTDLLSDPSRRKERLPWPDPDPVVLNPLGGENLYVSLLDFEEYVTSLKSFWSDLATALPV